MKKYLLIVVMFVCSMSMQAQFSGQGSGTEKDPYQITTADELFEVRNDLSAYYKVMEDIDLSAWITEPISPSPVTFIAQFVLLRM